MVDLWLQLLQLALHLSHSLPRGPGAPLARQGSLAEGLDPALDIRSQVALLVKSYQSSLQELMTQLLVHWKVSPAAMCCSATAQGCFSNQQYQKDIEQMQESHSHKG